MNAQRRAALAHLVLPPLAMTSLVAFTALTHTDDGYLDVQPGPSQSQPAWSDAAALAHRGCVASDAPSRLPARIVVQARVGAARAVPYDARSVRAVEGSWRDDDGRNDLFVIGKCVR